jgi:hypothetical protein
MDIAVILLLSIPVLYCTRSQKVDRFCAFLMASPVKSDTMMYPFALDFFVLENGFPCDRIH